MPYIPMPRREEIERQVFQDRSFPVIENAGELNFLISIILINYVNDNGLKYQSIADAVSACEGAKAEFQRRVVAPYEDKKMAQNGDLNWNH